MTAGKPSESRNCTYTASPKVNSTGNSAALESAAEAPATRQSSEELLSSESPSAPGITGRIISALAKPSVLATIIAVVALAGLGYAGYILLYKKKK